MCGSPPSSSTHRSFRLSSPLRVRLGRRSTALFALLLLVVLGIPTGSSALDVPEPEKGYWAPTALALLEYHRRLCDGIAGRVVAHWRGLGERDDAEQRAQDWVTEESLSDLVAGRAASDIIRTLLPEARAETDAETAASLERLHELENELCDTVALPLGPLEDFDHRVTDLLEKMDREKEELGRLLVVPDEVLSQALEPYLKSIQLAAFEAESEYLDYLESLRPQPVGPSHQDLMMAWHRRYTAATQGTKDALKDYLIARQSNDVQGMAGACREISAEVIPLLREESLFDIPVPQRPASKGYKMLRLGSLYQAYREIRNVATHCLAGRSRETVEALQAMQKELGESAAYLAKFSLQP